MGAAPPQRKRRAFAARCGQSGGISSAEFIYVHFEGSKPIAEPAVLRFHEARRCVEDIAAAGRGRQAGEFDLRSRALAFASQEKKFMAGFTRAKLNPVGIAHA